MRYIRIYMLKLKLAKIFKRAEQAVETDVPSGNLLYNELYSKAKFAVTPIKQRYPDFDETKEIPALDKLEKLTHQPELPDYNRMIQLGVLATLGAIITIGFVAALVGVSYHGWTSLFHLLHLV